MGNFVKIFQYFEKLQSHLNCQIHVFFSLFQSSGNLFKHLNFCFVVNVGVSRFWIISHLGSVDRKLLMIHIPRLTCTVVYYNTVIHFEHMISPNGSTDIDVQRMTSSALCISTVLMQTLIIHSLLKCSFHTNVFYEWILHKFAGS